MYKQNDSCSFSYKVVWRVDQNLLESADSDWAVLQMSDGYFQHMEQYYKTTGARTDNAIVNLSEILMPEFEVLNCFVPASQIRTAPESNW